MERSWFSKATASKYGLLSESSKHDLPRWRSPSPSMAASTIPPPIVQSTYATSSRPLPTKSVTVDRPAPADDRQGEVEADLQFLLDAQAEGLVNGFGGEADDLSSTGSTTPTAQSMRSASARRKARAARKTPSLRKARKGIYNSIIALSAIKDEELQIVDEEAAEQRRTLVQIDDWEQKRQALQEATRNVNDGEETVRAQRLRREADAMQEQINAVELQLADLQSRQRKLLRQAAAAENAVQARMASYTSSLSMLEADVQKFLSLHSAVDRSQTSENPRVDRAAKRVTLDAARQQCQADRKVAMQHHEDIENEKSALNEGAAVWQDVVAHVTDFEKRLRASLIELSNPQSAWDEPASQPPNNDQSAKDLLGNLESVLAHIEAKYSLAEDRDWKLLIAAIGAEVDALRRGRDLLQNVLHVASSHGVEGEADELVDTGSPVSGKAGEDGNTIHELDKSFETVRRPSQRQARSDSSEDGGPDPELLFSRQDLDR
ncbi:hypothetical protein LTR86_010531 [Recurvomyces mirabilis]|nr:hypothetical protein LTR86_010531 [Recurvomyces mirabilis]